jgi:hypothetical protein
VNQAKPLVKAQIVNELKGAPGPERDDGNPPGRNTPSAQLCQKLHLEPVTLFPVGT